MGLVENIAQEKKRIEKLKTAINKCQMDTSNKNAQLQKELKDLQTTRTKLEADLNSCRKGVTTTLKNPPAVKTSLPDPAVLNVAPAAQPKYTTLASADIPVRTNLLNSK